MIKWIDLSPLSDERGTLIAIESERSIPFVIKRIYYIFNTKQGARCVNITGSSHLRV